MYIYTYLFIYTRILLDKLINTPEQKYFKEPKT